MKQIQLSNKVEIRKNGLIFRNDLSYNEWAQIGNQLRLMEGSIQFWIGDWLNYGENSYKEWTQEFDPEGKLSYGYLRDLKWVARRIPLSNRNDNLSWSHHRYVADLEADDREILFKEAQDHKIPLSKFKILVHTYKMKLDVPEMTDAQINNLKGPQPDFDLVQPAVMACAELLEQIEKIQFDILKLNARDYLLSGMRDVIRIVGPIIVKYDEARRTELS